MDYPIEKRYGVRCSQCRTFIVSRTQSDEQKCWCGKTYISGGDLYLKYGWDESIPRPEQIEVDSETLRPINNYYLY